MSHVELTAGGLRWRLAPEHRELLLGTEGLRLEEWLQTGQARVIKHASHRTVYQVQLPGLHFFLKHNRSADARAQLREWLRPSKALAEYERAVEVASRDVPTFRVLAAGVPCGRSGDSFLLTHALEGSRQLNTFLELELPLWPEPRRTRLRQRLAVVLGKLLARMHDSGIVHHDLHPGNILLQLEADDRPRLFLIDLHYVRLGPPLSWPASRDNVVILNRWFSLRCSRSDRLRAWHAYCSARRGRKGEDVSANPGCLCPHRCREVETQTLTSNRGFWRTLDGRCLENNRRFRRVAAEGIVGHAVTDLDAAELLRDPDEPFRRAGVKLLKNSRSSTVAELRLTLNGTEQDVIWKRFRVTSWRDPWLALLRPTGALRSWTLGHAMRLRWLPTPRPLLVLHRKRLGLCREGYLLTAKVQDAEDLHEFIHRVRRLPDGERGAELRPVLEETARLIRDLHERQLSHRDLKAPNLLVTRRSRSEAQAASAEPLDHWPLTAARVWFIDLVGVRLHRRLDRRRRVQNLARLNASFLVAGLLSRTERLRFLQLYLGREQHDWRAWWRDVESATRQKVARNVRSGRPLF